MRDERSIKMFIYQPVYTVDENGRNRKYLHTKTRLFPYYPARKGDVFTGEKRVKDFIEMQNHATSKVVFVRYNYTDGTCGVVLEDKIVKLPKEEPKEETKEEPIAEEVTAS